MKLLYGKPIADKILNHLKNEIALLSEKPGLAVILVGKNQASELYVSLKNKKAKEIGMNFFLFSLPETIAEKEVLEAIKKLNINDKIHGIIVQVPLPKGLDQNKIIESIDLRKDADGFVSKNVEYFLEYKGNIEPVFPNAIFRLIESSGEILENKKAVIVANSNNFGKIMAATLEHKNILAEYFMAEDISANLDKIKKADIVISAVGLPGILNGQMFKENAIVIDGGIDKSGNKILGDVDFSSTQEKEGYLSPVPGGVGPITIACLLKNVYLEFMAQQK